MFRNGLDHLRDENEGIPQALDGNGRDPDLAQLRTALERTKLTQEIAQLATPWWRRAGIVTVVTALVAAVLPVTTAIQEHYQKERELAVADAQKQRELALQEQRQVHEIRTSYLDRLDRDGSRLRTLRFLVKTTSDELLREWAIEERSVIEIKVRGFDAQIAELEQELSKVTDPAARKELQEEIATLRAVRDGASYMDPAGPAGSETP